MKSWRIALIAATVLFLLGLGAGTGSFGRDRGFGRDDSFGRADADRDGFISWKEYRDFHREGSRGDFYGRDRDRDNRLGRDEWDPFGAQNDRWPSRR